MKTQKPNKVKLPSGRLSQSIALSITFHNPPARRSNSSRPPVPADSLLLATPKPAQLEKHIDQVYIIKEDQNQHADEQPDTQHAYIRPHIRTVFFQSSLDAGDLGLQSSLDAGDLGLQSSLDAGDIRLQFRPNVGYF